MRFVIGLLAAITMIPAVAQQSRYVELPRTDARNVRFVDVRGAKRSGRVVEMQYLDVTARPEGDAVPVDGKLFTDRIFCDWQAYQAIVSTKIDLDGEIVSTRSVDSFINFYAPSALATELAGIACSPNKLDSTHAVTLKEAMAIGASTTKRPPAPKPRDPNEPIPTVTVPPRPKSALLQNFPRPNQNEYGVVRAEHDTGNVLFIDWANYKREKNGIMLLTLHVLGGAASPDTYRNGIKVSSIELQCKARTIRVRGYQPFWHDLSPQRDKSGEPERSVAGSPLDEELLNTACKGRKPKNPITSMADAVAFADSVRK